MPTRRRIDPGEGMRALSQWLDATRAGRVSHPSQTAMAVRFSLEELAARAPGHALEVRVPPYGATQCLEGPRHTRGTPPAVVEMGPETWLGLVTGTQEWSEARDDAAVHASGERANLSAWLPLFAPDQYPVELRTAR